MASLESDLRKAERKRMKKKMMKKGKHSSPKGHSSPKDKSKQNLREVRRPNKSPEKNKDTDDVEKRNKVDILIDILL